MPNHSLLFNYTILRAQPEDAPRLKEIAVVAKAYWGYTPDWIARWASLIQVTHSYIEQHQVYKAAHGDTTIGWYGVILHDDSALLDDLWVTPVYIGKGVGRMLFGHARQTAQSHGAARLTLEADPNAVGFYQHMGATIVGQVDSAMGRPLPIMELRL